MGKVDRTVRNEKNRFWARTRNTSCCFKVYRRTKLGTISLTSTWRTALTQAGIQESRHEDFRSRNRSWIFFVSFLLTSNSLISFYFFVFCFALLSQGKSFFQRTVFDVTFLLWQQQNRWLFYFLKDDRVRKKARACFGSVGRPWRQKVFVYYW